MCVLLLNFKSLPVNIHGGGPATGSVTFPPRRSLEASRASSGPHTPTWHQLRCAAAACMRLRAALPALLCAPLTPRHSPPRLSSPWARSVKDHEQELLAGVSSFPLLTRNTSSARAHQTATRSVGAGNAGPDEPLLRDGHLIHATTERVLTRAECTAIVDEARGAMEAGVSASFKNTAANNHYGAH